MNEQKLTELWWKARIGYNNQSCDPEVLAKFAELIIRECAKFMDENSGYNDSDGCWFPEPEDMLKHFGVEE